MNEVTAQNATLPASHSALRDASGRFFKGCTSMNRRHGMSESKTHKIWTGMISRCNTPSATGYKNYGGRGVGVCERWLIFEHFYEDMGECPHGMSIDRIDGNADYSPGNCRWASRKEQNRNQRDLVCLTHKGETKCMSAWAEELGISAGTIRSRIRYGWSVERIITTPARAHKEYQYVSR